MVESKTTAKPAQATNTKPIAVTSQPVKTEPNSASTSNNQSLKQPAKTSGANSEQEGRYTYLLRIQVGSLQFSNLKGDFLGEPVISLRTRQYSEVYMILNDSSSEGRTIDNPTGVQDKPQAALASTATTLKAKDAGQNQVGKPTDGKPGSDTKSKTASTEIKADNKTIKVTENKLSKTTSAAQLKSISVIDQNSPKDSKSSISEKTESKPEQALDGSLWSQINAQIGSEVQIELGYPPDFVENKFVGKLYRVGRKLPDGVLLELVDVSATLGNSTTPTVVTSGEKPVDSAAFTATDPSALKVAKGQKLQTCTADSLSSPQSSTGQLSISKSSANLFSSAPAQNNKTPITPPKPVQGRTQVDGSTTQGQAIEQQKKAAQAAIGNPNQPSSGVLDVVTALTPDLKFIAATQHKSGDAGVIAMGKSALSAAVDQAALHGDVIIASGNTIKQVGPGQGESTGILLSWFEHRNAFIRPPTITKKTPTQLQSGYGALKVEGWSVNDKQAVSATVVTPSPTSPHPTGNIQVPKWGQVKLKDPIIPGSRFTWGDATRNGARVPESDAVMKGIIYACENLIAIEAKYGKGIEVTSWYRPPRENARVSSSGLTGPHTTGSAVDFYHPKMSQIHADYSKTWQGGVAISPGSFLHLDEIGNRLPGSPRRRWNY